jgi:hypothetical protein
LPAIVPLLLSLSLSVRAAEFQVGDSFLIREEFGRKFSDAHPVVASNGTNWMAAWVNPDTYRIEYESLDSNGSFITGGLINDSSAWDRIQLVSGGADYLLVWADSDPEDWSRYAIRGVSLKDNGHSESEPFTLHVSICELSQPALSWSPQGYALVWEEWQTETNACIKGKLLTPDAAPVGGASNSFALSKKLSDQRSPAVGWNGSAFFTAWEDGEDSTFWTPTVYGNYISQKGRVKWKNGKPLLKNQWYTQSSPTVSSGSNEVLVTWQTSDSYPRDVMQGMIINGRRRTLNPFTFGWEEGSPAVTPSTVGYLVVATYLSRYPWNQYTEIYTLETPDHTEIATSYLDLCESFAVSEGQPRKFLLVEQRASETGIRLTARLLKVLEN